MNISQSSPLYEYWISEQKANDENKRLLKLNKNEAASNLFRNEPYKWENLYQCAIRNVMRGDISSIKALMILLSTISKDEKNKVINSLEVFLDEHIIIKLRNEEYQDMESSKNFFTALRIIFCLFINPYELELKNEHKHIYEKTGMTFYNFRKLFLLNNSDLNNR